MANEKPRRGGLGDLGRNRFRSKMVAGDQLPDTVVPRSNRSQEETARLFPQTPWAFPESTRVKAYSYDYATGNLLVRFIKYSTPWIYRDIPVAVFEAFDSAPSKGEFINANLNQSNHHRASASDVSHYNYPS